MTANGMSMTALVGRRSSVYTGDKMETVSFTQMAEGTREDYLLLQRLEEQYVESLPDRLLAAVEALQTSLSGYQVTRYEHSLQSATRAYRDGQDEDYVVAALLHDIGDVLAPYTHGEMVAAILRPFLPERIVWIVKYHGLFQMVYYAHHYGEDRNARDEYKDHPWYDDCAEFCEKYDQNCFDPAYESLPLPFFEPMVRRVFSREPVF
jgi:predicted HD phosphohydrolase